MKKNIFTTIEITDTHLKFLQAQGSHNKKILCGFDIQEIKNLKDDEIVKILKQICSSKKIFDNNLTYVVSRQFLILKQLRVPSIHDDEVKKMIPLQLLNKIPYPIEDVIYDFHLIRKDKEGYSLVLVDILHNDIYNRFQKIFSRARDQSGKFYAEFLRFAGMVKVKYEEGKGTA